MIKILSLLAIALAPAIYLAILIYGRDKYEKEPKRVLLIAFLWGCFSTLPAAAIGKFYIQNGIQISESFWKTAFYAFVAVALTEELCKFIMLRFHAYNHKDFNEPFDGIVYASFVALGFATVENILYVFNYGFGTGILRMFTAVPAHFSFGVIMGYYAGKAKFIPSHRFSLMTQGVFYATVMHGAYDFFIMQQNAPALGIFTIGILVMSWRISKNAINELQADSKFRFHYNNKT
ncbi:MAG: PrsW family glutamic-type intramembrane protease [Chitinophagales bacterium]|nr:PrsW family glutamic-type intramembrane protease [Chitinophagales bacterium]MDW8273937.1 PrsW family glutamic-type intramembrane protease [Chitinophagales bacterium]